MNWIALTIIGFAAGSCTLVTSARADEGINAATVLDANRAVVGPIPARGAAIYDYAYSGQGLTGMENDVIDTASGAFIERLDCGPLHTGDGFDGEVPWMRDVSGATTPEKGGDRLRLAINQAYRNANLWWRPDRGGAEITYVGRETLDGVETDWLSVWPRGGQRFEAWFDTGSHLLLRIAEPQIFFKTRTIFSDFRREAGVMVAHAVTFDPGSGESGSERRILQRLSFGPERPATIFSRPAVSLTGVTLAGGAASIDVPFLLLNNHIYVQGRVNGKGPYTFIVDTGGHTLLSHRVVTEAGLVPIGETPMSGAGEKTASSSFAPVSSIDIGELHMEGQIAFITEIYAPEVEGIAVDGMIGFEVFRRLVVRIDYAHKMLTFLEPSRFSPEAAGIAVPFEFYDHLPFVQGFIDDFPADFDIDTGSRSELDVTAPTVMGYHLRDKYPNGVSNVTGWGVGGPSHAFVVRLQSIQLGSVRVASPVVDLSEDRAGSMSDSNYQGNIGSGLLSRFVVTFDYGHQKMYLTRIEPPPDGVGQYDRSGMWINAAPDGYKVMSVVNGGPAALAGIAVGDVIVTLDGYRGQPEGLSDARAELRTRAAGSIVQVTLRRGKDLRKVRLVLRDQI